MILLILAFDDNVLLGTIGGENVVLHESISLLLSMQISGLLSWILVFSWNGVHSDVLSGGKYRGELYLVIVHDFRLHKTNGFF